jgi:hypothetical protein
MCAKEFMRLKNCYLVSHEPVYECVAMRWANQFNLGGIQEGLSKKPVPHSILAWKHWKYLTISIWVQRRKRELL